MGTHLVTGAGSGIGAEVVARLHARGEELWLVARSEERGTDLAARYPGARVVVADLADPAAVGALDLPDALDSLVHSAGVVELAPVAEADAGSWRHQLDVNLVAPALLTRAALPALRAAAGTVVLVNSGSGLHANPGWSAYAASKHGLKALADSLRAEEAEHGVRVGSVYPGRTASPMQERIHDHEGKDYDPDAWIAPGTVADAVLHLIDLPADATVTDLTVRPRG